MFFKSELRVGNLAPDPTTTYQLFDRVVNVRDDTAVPLGLKGTVIGKVRNSVYEYLWIFVDICGYLKNKDSKCNFSIYLFVRDKSVRKAC